MKRRRNCLNKICTNMFYINEIKSLKILSYNFITFTKSYLVFMGVEFEGSCCVLIHISHAKNCVVCFGNTFQEKTYVVQIKVVETSRITSDLKEIIRKLRLRKLNKTLMPFYGMVLKRSWDLSIGTSHFLTSGPSNVLTMLT